MEQAKALRRLKERLKNAVVEYCKLEIFPDSSNILYCCSISDIQRFKVIAERTNHHRCFKSREVSYFYAKVIE